MAWFGQAFPSAYGWFEDIAFLTGDGTNKPQGVQSGPGVVTPTRAGTASHEHHRYDDIVKTYARMYPASMRNARWVASIDTFPQLAELSFTPSGGTPVPVMLWQMNAIGTPVASLLGRPIEFTEKSPHCPTPVTDARPMGTVEYLIGDRQAMSWNRATTTCSARTRPRSYPGSASTASRGCAARSPRTTAAATLSPYVVLGQTPPTAQRSAWPLGILFHRN